LPGVSNVSDSRISDPIPAQAGIGLRFPHQSDAARGVVDAAWFEVHPENYFQNAHALDELRRVREHRPLSLHAVGLSLGSHQGVDATQLQKLTALSHELEPGLVSDHLSWSQLPGAYLADLLPLPYTEEALQIVARNVSQVQEALGRPILVENPSTYLQFANNVLTEPQFLAELCRRAGCGVLLDVNNIFVSASNQRQSAVVALDEFMRCLPLGTVQEIHLAGHAVVSTDDGREMRIDDHGSAVIAAVWSLYERCVAQLGAVPTLIEWDTRIPAFNVLKSQAAEADARLLKHARGYAVAG
jgi:uncharacterized protein (UPF0276 family)